MQNYTTLEVSKIINAELMGDPNVIISGLSSFDEPRENHLCFFSGKSMSVLSNNLNNKKFGAILLSKELDLSNITSNVPLILGNNPQKSFITLVDKFFPKQKYNFKIHPKSEISSNVILGNNVQIGPFTYIAENCIIGENTIIHPNVTIYQNVKIGSNCEIHSGVSIRENIEIGNNIIIQNGAIIGADGFGYIPDTNGLAPVPQVGNVIISDNVDIGANSCIDRATINSTRIGVGTKIDNLVQIGHNTQIGSNTIICGQAAIAGSSKIGNQVVLGGNVGVADHTEVSDGCRFAGFSGLTGKYTEKGDYAGNPAIPAKLYRKVVSIMPKIPELAKKLKKEIL